MIEEKIIDDNFDEAMKEATNPCCPVFLSEKGNCYGILGEASPCTNPLKYKKCVGYLIYTNKIEVKY
jgi:hypothetical protein